MNNYQQPTTNIWFPTQREPLYDPSDHTLLKEFKDYWKREKDRCINGFYLADGRVFISGWLYTHTVYWKIAAYIETSDGKKHREIITPLLLDTHWDVAQDFIKCEDEGHFYNLVGSRDWGKSVIGASRAGWQYTFFDNSESVISAGADNYIKLATDKIEDGLTNIHPIWKKNRLANDWKREVRAGWKDKKSNQVDPKSSNSRILMRNYENGIKSMAANGTRPGFHLIDEEGTIQHLIACIKDSDGCWWSGGGSKPSCLVMLTGTGGDMEVGAEAGEVFFKPEAYNMLAFDNPETGGKMGRFISALRSRMKFKEEKTLAEYLNIVHPDLERVKILVSNEERALKEWWEPAYQRALKSGNQKSIIKFKAYWPRVPSDCFLQISSNNYNVEAAKKQKLSLLKLAEEMHDGFIGQRVEIFHDGQTIKHKHSEKLPITQYPAGDDNTDAPVIMWEPPIQNPPWGLYLAGVDPYRQDSAEYSESLGAVYIYKRMHEISSEKYQDMFVASYVARPRSVDEWNEQARLLIKYYNAFTLVENDDMTFIRYMQNKGDDYYLADQPEWLKDVVPHSNIARSKGIHRSSEKVRNFLRTCLKRYLDDVLERTLDDGGATISEILGVVRVQDLMLIEEIIKFNKDGNFDREVACFRKGTPVLTPDGYTPIDNLIVGSKVITHTGIEKAIAKTYITSRNEQQIISIKPLGLEEIECTPEHPFLVATITKGVGRKYKQNTIIGNLEWKIANSLSSSDYLYIPRRRNLLTSVVSDRLLYILGWYLADGHRSNNTVRITFQSNQLELAKQIESYLLEVDDFKESVYYPYNHLAKKYVKTISKRKKPRIYKIKNVNAYNLEFNCTYFNRLLDEYVLTDKSLSKELFNSSQLLPLVLGFLEGDGHQKSTKAKGSINTRDTIEVSGMYINLIKQIRQILWDNGIWCTTNYNRGAIRLDIQDRKGINKIIGSMDCEKRKFDFINDREQKQNHILIENGILIPIKNISTYIVSDTMVYNLEVEEDNSYIVDGVAVHNCSLAIALADKMEPLGKVNSVGSDPRYQSYLKGRGRKDSSHIFTPSTAYSTFSMPRKTNKLFL